MEFRENQDKFSWLVKFWLKSCNLVSFILNPLMPGGNKNHMRLVEITLHARTGANHINQADQTTTWKETCIEFPKYAKYRLWANIDEIYWDFRSVRITSL